MRETAVEERKTVGVELNKTAAGLGGVRSEVGRGRSVAGVQRIELVVGRKFVMADDSPANNLGDRRDDSRYPFGFQSRGRRCPRPNRQR